MKKLYSIIAIVTAIVAVSVMTACSGRQQTAGDDKSQTSDDKNKTVVCYFSATGTTAAQARRLADMTGGDLYEIAPEKPYTNDDLNWRDSLSRSSVEMHDRSSRPALKDTAVNLSEYDVVLIGYPNWWKTAPTIINTFIEAAGLDGKTVAPFMTSGGDDITVSEADLKNAYPAINWKKGLLMNNVSDEQVTAWLKTVTE